MTTRAERRRHDRMRARNPLAEVIPPDAKVAVVCAWCDGDSIGEAKQRTHDTLIRLMGDTRGGPVEWLVASGEHALRTVNQMVSTTSSAENARYYRELAAALRVDGGFLVIASASEKQG